jgi:hypothetical protein
LRLLVRRLLRCVALAVAVIVRSHSVCCLLLAPCPLLPASATCQLATVVARIRSNAVSCLTARVLNANAQRQESASVDRHSQKFVKSLLLAAQVTPRFALLLHSVFRTACCVFAVHFVCPAWPSALFDCLLSLTLSSLSRRALLLCGAGAPACLERGDC